MSYNSTYNLQGKPIASTYGQLMETDGHGGFFDGHGNEVYFTSSVGVSSSYAETSSYSSTASYSLNGNSGDSVSSSWASESISASYALTGNTFNTKILNYTDSITEDGNTVLSMSAIWDKTNGVPAFLFNDQRIFTDANGYTVLDLSNVANVVTLNGNLDVSNRLTAVSITSSLRGTASYANTASYSPNQLPDVTDNTTQHIVTISGSLDVFDSASNAQSKTLLVTGHDTQLTRSVYANYRQVGVSTADYTSSAGIQGASGILDVDSGNYAHLFLQGSSSAYGLKRIILSTNGGYGSFDGNITTPQIGVNNTNPVYDLDVNGQIGNSLGDTLITSFSGSNLTLSSSGVLNLKSTNQINLLTGPTTSCNVHAGYNFSAFTQQGVNLHAISSSIYLDSPLGVGINNSSPSYSLDVDSDINFTGN